MNKTLPWRSIHKFLLFTFTSGFFSQCLIDWNILKFLPSKALTGLEAQWHLMTGKISPAVPPPQSPPTTPLLYWCWHKLGTALAEHRILGLSFVGFLAKSIFSPRRFCIWSFPPQYSHWYWYREGTTRLEMVSSFWQWHKLRVAKWPSKSVGFSKRASASDLTLQHLQSSWQIHLSRYPLKPEIVFTYWKISFSSKPCVFAPVLPSLLCLVSSFLDPQSPLFQWLAYCFSRLSLTFSCPWGGWQSHSKAHLAGNRFFSHDKWFLLWWQRERREDLYKCIIPQSIFPTTKFLPKPPSPRPHHCTCNAS